MIAINPFRKPNVFNPENVVKYQKESIHLDNQINEVIKNIEHYEEVNVELFKKGVSQSALRKKILAEQIKDNKLKVELGLQTFESLSKQKRYISNLLSIMTYMNELRLTPVWKEIKSLGARELEDKLIDINLSGKRYNAVLDTLNGVFKNELPSSNSELDDSTKEIMSLWDDFESGAIDAEAAKIALSIETDVDKSREVSVF